MRPSDRPVIAEPEARPSPPPFRIRLGDVVHLNGAIPRGAPLQDAVPKRCQGCAGLFVAFGRGHRAAYCPECRAKRCPTCNRSGGEHYAYCCWMKPRPCRGCGVELGHATRRLFCEPCWARQCPECYVRGGRHQRTCLYERRQRRTNWLTERLNLVTEEHIVAVYLEHRTRAIRLAERICGPLMAQDVVQDVVLYLLERREYLRFPPGRAYFMTAVRSTARRRLRYAWSRRVVAMGPEDLVDLEEMLAGCAAGEPRPQPVRLPEPGRDRP